MKLLLYCSKKKPYLYRVDDDDEFTLKRNNYDDYNTDLELEIYEKYYKSNNGKIVAECDFEVEEITKKHVEYFKYCYITESLNEWELMNKSLLNGVMMNDYLQGNKGYAIHIKNLKVFDKPRKLSEFKKPFPSKECKNCLHDFDCAFSKLESESHHCRDLYKAPQNMMYVSDGDEKKVLIPIHPEQLCKELNGECTIIIKRKVLKGMLEK